MKKLLMLLVLLVGMLATRAANATFRIASLHHERFIVYVNDVQQNITPTESIGISGILLDSRLRYNIKVVVSYPEVAVYVLRNVSLKPGNNNYYVSYSVFTKKMSVKRTSRTIIPSHMMGIAPYATFFLPPPPPAPGPGIPPPHPGHNNGHHPNHPGHPNTPTHPVNPPHPGNGNVAPPNSGNHNGNVTPPSHGHQDHNGTNSGNHSNGDHNPNSNSGGHHPKAQSNSDSSSNANPTSAPSNNSSSATSGNSKKDRGSNPY